MAVQTAASKAAKMVRTMVTETDESMAASMADQKGYSMAATKAESTAASKVL